MTRPEQPPDSILLVTLDVLAGVIELRHEDVLRDALRLVNNCCQDDGRSYRVVVWCLLTLDRWEPADRT